MKRKFMFVAMMAAMCSTALFTSCVEEGDDAEVLATNVDFSKLTTIAQPDGTILIEGSITANGKIKKFELQTLDGKPIVDLATKNEKSVEKDENGKKVKTFTMDISSVAVAVQQMQVVFKVKDGETGKGCAQIGETYEFDAGTGNSPKGSYMSFYKNQSFTFPEVVDQTTGEATENAQYVEVILGKEDGVPTLKSAKTAKSAAFATAAADAKIFPAAVLTSTNCIATYNIVFGADGETAKVSGVIIKKGDGGGLMQIDNTALFN